MPDRIEFFDFALPTTEALLEAEAAKMVVDEWPTLRPADMQSLRDELAARLYANARALVCVFHYHRERPSITNDWDRFSRIFQRGYVPAFVTHWKQWIDAGGLNTSESSATNDRRHRQLDVQGANQPPGAVRAPRR